jgi:hypothetical protein
VERHPNRELDEHASDRHVRDLEQRCPARRDGEHCDLHARGSDANANAAGTNAYTGTHTNADTGSCAHADSDYNANSNTESDYNPDADSDRSANVKSHGHASANVDKYSNPNPNTVVHTIPGFNASRAHFDDEQGELPQR